MSIGRRCRCNYNDPPIEFDDNPIFNYSLIDESYLKICEMLNLRDSPITDLHTKFLSGLYVLVLYGTKISDIDTKYVTELRYLDITCCINVRSIDTEPLTKLKALFICRTQIVNLNTAPLKCLQQLDIHFTGISELDVENLVML